MVSLLMCAWLPDATQRQRGVWPPGVHAVCLGGASSAAAEVPYIMHEHTLARGTAVTIAGLRWVVLSTLSSGAFSMVYQAREAVTGRHVALKQRREVTPLVNHASGEDAWTDDDDDDGGLSSARGVEHLVEQTRAEATAQLRAAMEDAAPVIASTGNFIVMDLLDSATHATLQMLASRMASVTEDADADQQLAAVAVFARLHAAGLPYDSDDFLQNLFVPLHLGGPAVLINHKPLWRGGSRSVWQSLVAYFRSGGCFLRMVGGVLRDHREWFGLDDAAVPPAQWAAFVDMFALVCEQLEVTADRPAGFNDRVQAILSSAGKASAASPDEGSDVALSPTASGAVASRLAAGASDPLPAGCDATRARDCDAAATPTVSAAHERGSGCTGEHCLSWLSRNAQEKAPCQVALGADGQPQRVCTLGWGQTRCGCASVKRVSWRMEAVHVAIAAVSVPARAEHAEC